jgi:hypothetical protein
MLMVNDEDVCLKEEKYKHSSDKEKSNGISINIMKRKNIYKDK